ncbi:MAG TPA: FAD-dependent oxidoreductase [Candidatus Sulfotelmatobacter sp.]|jgi:2-polyprenyl-6-methoxyphenol hydroxylase-like FAD-dependent oxidoreductase|nr:FAD-dependent oxidoreductase [Candidatus Sulfotelmatobacter sp.]
MVAPPVASASSTDKEVLDVQETSCCVVGGGPAGAVLSLLLARHGIPVTLLEMHKDFDREFRGDTIHPSTLEILDQLGLADKLHKIPHTKISGPTIKFADGDFQPFNLGRLKTCFPYILLVPQVRFLEFITCEAAKYPSFKLVMHANVTQLLEENAALRGVRYQAPDGVHDIRSALTVGADGRFSIMRRLAGFEPIKTSPPMDVLWFRLPKLPGEPEISGGAFGGIGGGRILILLERNDYWQAGLVFPKGHYQELRNAGVEAIRKSIAEIEPRFGPHAESLTDWHQLLLLSVESSRCPLWHKPGLLLIGDAAHVMSPIGGVGINYAIQDAVVAANVLTAKLKSGHVSEADLAEVQRQREWPTRIIQWAQSLLQRRIIAGALNATQAGNRPWQLKLFASIPVVRDIPPRLIAFGTRRVRISEV